MSASPPQAPKAKDRILVVDDDRLVLATVTHGLIQAGYDVIDADNGDDAILLAREHRPQLALLDIRMEGKSGFDVAETLRDAYGIPFMFLSAFSDAATLAKVEALGAQAYLIKPLDVGQIVPSVAAVLARLADSTGSAVAAGAAPATRSAPAKEARVGAPPGAPAAATTVGPVVAPAVWVADPLTLAVGVLMHRHSYVRQQAWQHLQRLAQDQQRTVAEQADRLLEAVEELARSAP